ncbi:hypothetical protein DIPPA_29418 [Diplonema papillatum]|nr:hypothetical protein DIPPA_29418 [Diplonema papillatum]
MPVAFSFPKGSLVLTVCTMIGMWTLRDRKPLKLDRLAVDTRGSTVTDLFPHAWFKNEQQQAGKRISQVGNITYDAVNVKERDLHLNLIRRAASGLVVRSTEFVDVGDDQSVPPNAIIATIETDALAALGISRLWFECRLTNPRTGALVPCFAELLETGSEQVYSISAPFIPHSGDWRLILLLAHVGERGGHPIKGDIVQGVQFIGFEYLPRPVVSFRLEEPVKKSCGYWTICKGYDPLMLHRLPGGSKKRTCAEGPASYLSCRHPPTEDGLPSKLMGTADREKHLILLGDSHPRSWRNSIHAAIEKVWLRDKKTTYIQRLGPISYVPLEGMEATDKPESQITGPYTTGTLYLEFMLDLLRVHLEELSAELAEKRAPGGNQTLTVVVVVHFGTWDIRDVSVGEYCGRIEKLHGFLQQRSLTPEKEWGPGVSVRWVWRTVPAYSYGAKRFRGEDYRTNENILDANACAVKALSNQWQVHDSFAYTHPTFLAPCDSVHYLCLPPSASLNARARNKTVFDCFLKSDKTGEVVGRGCAGKYELLDFLHTQW